MVEIFPNLNQCRKEIADIDENALSTIFILCYLHINFFQRSQEWMLLKKKSMNWLSSVNIDFETYKTNIEKYIS